MILKEKEDLTEEEKAAILKKVLISQYLSVSTTKVFSLSISQLENSEKKLQNQHLQFVKLKSQASVSKEYWLFKPPVKCTVQPHDNFKFQALCLQEKLKIALEKLKIASNLKIAMKAYNVNNSSKTIWVEQKQTAWDVCQVLAEKNYYKPGSDWTLVEHITDLQIGR